jgi:hypothetical protein
VGHPKPIKKTEHPSRCALTSRSGRIDQLSSCLTWTYVPFVNDYITDFSVYQEKGAYGLYNGAIGLTLLPASVLAGVLWQGIGPWSGLGPAAPFLFGGILALLSAVLLWRWVR